VTSQQTRGAGWALAIGAGAALVWAARQGARRYSFRDKVVVITGGARGFGLALARRFAAEGAQLVLVGRDTGEMERATAELSARAVRPVIAMPCDVRDEASVETCIAAILRIYGRVDVLVNNAGVIQCAPFEHVQLDDYRDSLDTHFWGPLYFARACLPPMRRQGGGRIVNISSIGGRISVPHLSAYCAGKFALVGLSAGMHAELKSHGIVVTTVTPMLMRTGSHRNVIVRGRHREEAVWFALGTATSLTSIDADRSARQVVEAVRTGRAHVSPGWQGRAAELAQALLPDTTAWLLTQISALLPPAGRSASADRPEWSRDLDTGRIARVFPTEAARRFNQPVAADEAAARAWRQSEGPQGARA